MAPSSADTDRMSVSATQPLSRGIVEHRIAHLDQLVARAHGIPGAHALAVARWPACQQAEPDPVAERRRERDRRHVALVVGRHRLGAHGHEMRAGPQPRRAIDRLEADQRRPVGRQQRRPVRHDAADVVLARRHHAAEPQVARRGLPVDLVAGDVALLDAHDTQRLGAVGRDGELAARLHDAPDQRVAIARRHRDLVGEFAREREAEQARLDAAHHRDLAAPPCRGTRRSRCRAADRPPGAARRASRAPQRRTAPIAR